MFQRDVFIQEITKRLEKDKNIFFLSADFGAPALDILREKSEWKYIYVGYATERLNLVDVVTLEELKSFPDGIKEFYTDQFEKYFE